VKLSDHPEGVSTLKVYCIDNGKNGGQTVQALLLHKEHRPARSESSGQSAWLIGWVHKLLSQLEVQSIAKIAMMLDTIKIWLCPAQVGGADLAMQALQHLSNAASTATYSIIAINLLARFEELPGTRKLFN
jgi:hypothetical protein